MAGLPGENVDFELPGDRLREGIINWLGFFSAEHGSLPTTEWQI